MITRVTLAVLAALTVTLFCLESLATPPASSEPGWEKIKDADGVVAYARNVPGSSLLAFKGEGFVDAPPMTVAWAFLDTERAPEWIADLVSSSVVRWLSPNEYVEYNHLHTPFVMKDRDFVSKVTLTMDRSTHQFTIAYGATQDDTGAPRTDYVRGEIKNSRFILSPVDGGRRTFPRGRGSLRPDGKRAEVARQFLPEELADRHVLRTAPSGGQGRPEGAASAHQGLLRVTEGRAL